MSISPTVLPVSPAQKRLWILNQLNPEDTSYNLLITVCITGSLDQKVLSQALNLVVHKHESLRANIIEINQQLEQHIATHKNAVLHSHECQTLDQLREVFKSEANHPFDLATDDLFRFTLIQQTENTHVFIANIHHIVTDGWSMANFVKDLGQSYHAIASKDLSQMMRKKVAFADLIQKKTDYLNSDKYKNELMYWTEKLKDSQQAVKFNHIKPKSPEDGASGHRYFFKINSTLLERLKALALSQGVTLNMLMLAQYYVLLFRYTGQEDISIGSPVAGRRSQEEFDSIGFFVNSIVYRDQINANMLFTDFLTAVKKTSINALKYQDVPFINLVEALNPERSSTTNPLYNTSFAFQNMEKPDNQYGDLSFRLVNLEHFDDDELAWLENDTGHSLFDLSIELIQTHKNSLVATFEYNTDLFDEAFVKRMAKHYTFLLDDLCNDPNQRISEISLLSEQERQQQVTHWQKPPVAHPDYLCVQQMFEQQVVKTPDNRALVCSGQQLSYQELNAKANQMAHYLQNKGIGNGQSIGICLSRSLEMIVALYGVIKSGASYIPMDISYPKERLLYMLEETNSPLIITQSDVQEKLGIDAEKVFLVDQQWDELDSLPADNLPLQNKKEDPFYTIFTSGSTGLPKGASVKHRGELNLLPWYINDFNMTADDNILLMSAFGFDLTQKNLFAPLMCGATLVIPEVDDYDNDHYIQLINLEKITWLNCAPNAFYPLIENTHRWSEVNTLRYVFLGGETINVQKIQTWNEQSNCTVVNSYGPTECTDIAAYHVLETLDDYNDKAIPIGQANHNVQLYIMDKNQNLLPEGCEGELLIGGEGVGLGYINQPELTNEKFIPSPFSDNERLYKTGDLVRYQGEGDVEFSGRVDFQVKLRGLRIELGEIEYSLQQQEEINEALAMVIDDQIVAYITAEKTLDESALKAKLLEFLPQYMLPHHYVILDSFPLTAHGKVDRKALPEFTAQVKNEYVAPCSDLEISLASLWANVLQVEKVGIEDDFFDLGGHSLLATQLVSRIVSDMHRKVSLKDIFDHKTIRSLANFLDDTGCEDTQAAIEKSTISDNKHPLSFAQSRLWFIQALDPTSIAYTMPATFNLAGNLNVAALEHAFLKVIQRHEMLRVHIIEQDEQVYQSIYDVNDWTIPIYDFSTSSSDQSVIEDQFKQTFDLVHDHLIRTQLIKLEKDKHTLIVSMHHIISDGWSVGILMQEISQYYDAFCQNKIPSLSSLPIQYVDYAAWQGTYLAGEHLQNELNFWTDKLADSSTLELMTDFPRPVKQSFSGASVKLSIASTLTQQIKALSGQQGTTLFMTLLTGLYILLKHYSGQRDICIGSPIANRNRKEVEGLIGFFVNTLVLRQIITPEQSIKDLLQSIKHTTLDAYAHQDTPFEKIVDSLDLERSMSHTPLFQVMFVLQNQASEAIKLHELDIEFLPYDNKTAKFDLTFNIEELNESLEITLEYNCDLFKKETVTRLLNHYQAALKAIVTNSDQSVDEVSLLNLMEKKQILYDFNNTKCVADTDLCLHQIVENHVKEIPDQNAVVYKEEHINYQQLNQLANQLAHYLIEQGIEKNNFVGLFIDRSVEMIIGILASLKAGAAYVPIDPSYPDDRIQYMLEDSQTHVILTKEKLRSRLVGVKQNILCLDTELQKLQQFENTNLDLEIDSKNLAYMIYTSGSTGQPKGVVCHHKGLVNLMNDYQHKQFIAQGDRCNTWSTFSFDASVLEIFLSLTAGGELHIMPEEVRTDGLKVIEFLNEHKINNCFFPAVYLTELRDWVKEHPGQSCMKRMITGVESVEEAILNSIRKNIPGLQFANSYGPTETTIVGITYMVDPDNPSGQHNAPIGTPVENTQTYILDEHRNPVPIGVKGEIYIGGAGVTYGYWNKKKLTEEKFVPNIYSPDKSKTLYRTGDIAFYHPNGNVQFVGRVDNQIKLRGYRIELGEIETRLKALPVVNESVVTIFEENKNKRLISYVTLDKEHVNTGMKLDNSYFREQLLDVLPDYMIPGAFIVLDKMPLLPNGKLDKKSLPEPNLNREENYQAPVTQEEIILSQIWSDVLNIEKVGVNDNFFDLGGHSLLATRIVTRINAALDTDLKVMQLFEAPYIEQLTKHLKAGSDLTSKLPMAARNEGDETELTFSQERFWFLDKYEQGNTAYNIPMALTITGKVDVVLLEKSFQMIIARHEGLRTNFVENEAGQVKQVIHTELNWSLKVTQLPSDQEQETLKQPLKEQLITEMVSTTFDLANDTLFSASLLIINDSESLLLLNIHHIIADGWSMGIMLTELNSLYSALSDKKKPELFELPLQYGDFANWQRQLFARGDMDYQFDYWREQLSDVSVLELPIDKKRPALQTFNGSRLPFVLDTEKTQQINHLCQKKHVSPFMFFLSVLNVLLYRYTHQGDICIGTPIAGRNQEQSEGMIGLFLNTLAIRTHIDVDADFTSLLEQVKQTTLNAYAHQDAPFDHIVDELKLPRNMSTTPVFQVMLSMQNTPVNELQFSGLKLTPVELDNPTAKFDLYLDIAERDEQYKMEFEYNTDLFEAATIEQLQKHYVTLIQLACDVIANNTSEKVGSFDFISDLEKDQLLNQWNKTQIDLYSGSDKQWTVFELFEQQAEATPDNIAVVFGDEALTYKELNEQSNRLAHYLIDQGVMPDTFIGISVDRSAEMLIGLLAIMKAGAAYVPMATDYPIERLLYMLKDSTATHLITSSELKDKYSSIDVQKIILDELNDELEPCASSNVNIRKNVDIEQALAYVIYTSGSTGLPKGVCIEHHNLSNFLLSMQEKPGIKASDRLLAVTATSFDIHTLELYTPLICGATIVIADQLMVMDGAAIKDTLAQQSISVMQATPATWKMLINNDWQASAAFKALCGGEPLGETLKQALAGQESIELWNMYGPTETTVWSSVQRIESADSRITVGKPIANTTFYVLDTQQQPVPRGVTGELYIGGDGVARGYLNGQIDRTEMTAERFIHDPFVKGNQRFYRTGDACRYLINGELEVLGRMDDQVKVNGYRIELGEIDHALHQQVSVKEAVTVVKNEQLVAYIIVTKDYDENSLRKSLFDFLPAYMVPGTLMSIESMPLTPNGKIDRKALPEVDTQTHEYVAPETDTEKAVAKIWQNILDVERVGLNDNYFSVGGTSLKLAQVLSDIQALYPVDIPLKSIFMEPTLKSLTDLITEKMASGEVVDLGAEMITRHVEEDEEDEYELDDLLADDGEEFDDDDEEEFEL